MTLTSGVVRCVVVNRSDVTPEEGARCAKLMHETLTQNRHHRGLVFDVRQGPQAFGPKTRAALEELFQLAEGARMNVAVLVRDNAMQKLQFGSLCRECAPNHGKVCAEPEDATAWAEQGRSQPRGATGSSSRSRS